MRAGLWRGGLRRCGSACGSWGGSKVRVGLGQLGPDEVPVVGAQVFAGHSAIGGPFNGHAVGGPRAPIRIAVLPLADLSVAGHSRPLPKLADAECVRAG